MRAAVRLLIASVAAAALGGIAGLLAVQRPSPTGLWSVAALRGVPSSIWVAESRVAEPFVRREPAFSAQVLPKGVHAMLQGDALILLASPSGAEAAWSELLQGRLKLDEARAFQATGIVVSAQRPSGETDRWHEYESCPIEWVVGEDGLGLSPVRVPLDAHPRGADVVTTRNRWKVKRGENGEFLGLSHRWQGYSDRGMDVEPTEPAASEK